MFSIDQLFNDEYQWGQFHDVVSEVKLGKYTPEALRLIFDQLPESINDLAQMWGISDTVVRDDAYVFLRQNPEIILPEKNKDSILKRVCNHGEV